MHLIFDIGGTKSRFAFTEDYQAFKFEPLVFYTKKNYIEEIDYIKNTFKNTAVESIIGGFPGIIKENTLTFAPNLPDYVDRDIVEDFKNIFGDIPINLYNDAKLAALGEAIYGAGKQSNSICYLTFGTGIGGGIVKDKKIDLNSVFEPGHTISNIGSNSTFEQAISGGAIRKLFNGKTPEPTDRNFWNTIEKGIASLLINIYLTNPIELFVLGGGIFANKNVSLTSVKDYYSQFSKIEICPEICVSGLGDFSGLYGAMHLLKNP